MTELDGSTSTFEQAPGDLKPTASKHTDALAYHAGISRNWYTHGIVTSRKHTSP
eukprot:m.222484 g.222484  ORF g.222484 m.222484 type:complete len:54 (+) comp15625_c0_seq3:1431-1592(+)